MSHLIVRTPASFFVLLTAMMAHMSLGQSTDSSGPPSSFNSPAAQLQYSYRGPSSWQMDGQGKPLVEAAKPRQVSPPQSQRPTSTGRWSPPVVAAQPRLHSAFDSAPSTADQGPGGLSPQRSTHADSYHPPIADDSNVSGQSGEEPEPSLTEKVNSTAKSIVGGWNWLALEVNESFAQSRGRSDRLARRTQRPGCGRRYFLRRERVPLE
jgi:hypothetical protein